MLEDFVERVTGLDGIDSFQTFMAREVERFGFNKFTYLALRVPDSAQTPFVVTTFPQEWAIHYGDNDYVNFDPVLGNAASRMEPFDWPSLRAKQSLTSRQKRVLDEASDFGMPHGAAVPIHGPRGAFAIMSVTTEEPAKEFRSIWSNYKMYIHMMSLYYHSSVEKNLLRPLDKDSVGLTDREREVLLWTARGKTAWEVSEILSISAETVNFHLKNCMKKIGVYSKHHAVVKAILMGLIFP